MSSLKTPHCPPGGSPRRGHLRAEPAAAAGRARRAGAQLRLGVVARGKHHCSAFKHTVPNTTEDLLACSKRGTKVNALERNGGGEFYFICIKTY